MRTTVAPRRARTPPVDTTTPCSRSRRAVSTRARPARRPLAAAAMPTRHAPWSTAKLGLVVSVLAAIATLVVDATTALPSQAIVLAVMTVAFALSLHATTRRPPPTPMR